MDQIIQTQVIIGIVALAIGLGIGFLLGNLKSKRASTRAQDAEAELDAYRRQVTDHFGSTAEHFQALGLQYKALYEHLAAGADKLCDTTDAAQELSFVPQGMLARQAQNVTDDTGVSDTAPPEDAAESAAAVEAAPEAGDVLAEVADESVHQPEATVEAVRSEDHAESQVDDDKSAPSVGAKSDAGPEDERIYH